MGDDGSATGARLTRRRAITYGVGATTVLAVPGLLENVWPRSVAGTQAALAATVSRHRELRHPRALRSRHGRLHVRLTCRPGIVHMGAPKPVRTYTYDGTVPGYTWELQGGDVLTVDLHNHLPPLPHRPKMTMDRPHEWTTTNLHTHGLHVSPSGNADNVFLEIPPGDHYHYRIPVPEDHPAGIFWYHPHHHGAVTQQVRGGMAGLIIVRGDLDRVPEVRAATERVLVLQSIELGADYELLDPIPDPTKEQAFFPRKNVLYTVNGTLTPTITMHPGEVQRWRLLNAAEGKFLSLKLEDHDLNVVAWDGLTMHAPETAELVMMSAGNRVEMLVRAGKPGVYKLMLTPGSSQKPNIPGMPASIPESQSRAEFFCRLGAAGSDAQVARGLQDQPPELEPRAIATLVVRGHGPQMHLPESLPAFDPPILPIAAQAPLRVHGVARSDERVPLVRDRRQAVPARPGALPGQARHRRGMDARQRVRRQADGSRARLPHPRQPVPDHGDQRAQAVNATLEGHVRADQTLWRLAHVPVELRRLHRQVRRALSCHRP